MIYYITHENIFKSILKFCFLFEVSSPAIFPIKNSKSPISPLFWSPTLILKDFSSPRTLLSSKIQFPSFIKRRGSRYGQFSNRKWVFLKNLDHSSVSWEITLLLFLAETLYAIDKSSTAKCKFSDLPLLVVKFTKFAMSFLQPRTSFSSNFASLISVMRDNSSVLFHLKLYMLSTKETRQSANFRTFNCSHEN